jgi:hypothetical protein
MGGCRLGMALWPTHSSGWGWRVAISMGWAAVATQPTTTPLFIFQTIY